SPGQAKGGSASHAGRDYWFCNPKCRDRFLADPDRYLHPPTAPGSAPPPPATRSKEPPVGDSHAGPDYGLSHANRPGRVARAAARSADARPGTAPAPAKDPVCGLPVPPGQAKGGSASHAGRDYWFCNPKCRDRFLADPERYVAPVTAAGSATPPPAT